MPFATFGELQRLGLVLEVWCSTCKSSRPVTINDHLAARRFGCARFTCGAQRRGGAACRGLGHPHIVPAIRIERGATFVSLNCPRCVPPWSASPVELDRPPWSKAPIDTATERYRCPACGGHGAGNFPQQHSKKWPLTHHWLIAMRPNAQPRTSVASRFCRHLRSCGPLECHRYSIHQEDQLWSKS